MKEQNFSNFVNTSVDESKNHQVNDLMQSIQNKLSMLACDNSVDDFEASKLSTPKRQFLTATDENKNKKYITIHDLETSQHKKAKQSSPQLGQSRIVSRINEIQHFYMDKLQQMSTRASNLQYEVQALSKLNEDLINQNQSLKAKLKRQESQQSQIISSKIDQFKAQLIQKFSKQAENHYQQHIKQISSLSDQLLQEKGKRKYLQQQVGLLRNEKANLEQFYKNLLENHRNLIKYDIEKTQKSAKQQKKIVKASDCIQQQASTVKRKTKKKDKPSISRRSEQMSNQQMIPFLAKGIQDLKDQLKIK